MDEEPNVYWYEVDVERIVDGDTFTGSLSFGYGLVRKGQWFRLAGIDTPERGQPGFERSTEFLRERIEGKRIIINSHKDETGRWRRIVCDVYADGENVNEALLAAKLAVIPSYL